jgi:hypothetical protein
MSAVVLAMLVMLATSDRAIVEDPPVSSTLSFDLSPSAIADGLWPSRRLHHAAMGFSMIG